MSIWGVFDMDERLLSLHTTKEGAEASIKKWADLAIQVEILELDVDEP